MYPRKLTKKVRQGTRLLSVLDQRRFSNGYPGSKAQHSLHTVVGVLVCVEIAVKNEFMILHSYEGVVMAKARLKSGQGHPLLEKNALTQIKTALCFGSDSTG